MRRNGKFCWEFRTAVWLFGLAAGGYARADVIQTAGQAPEVGATLTELRDGRLFYRSHTDQETSLPIEQITYLQVTGWTPFNEAEKQQRAGRHREAARWYQRAVDRPFRRVGGRALKTDSAGDAMDYELLARCRLLPSLDQQGQWDQAVGQYLRIIESMPEVLDSLRPVNMPSAESDAVTKALDLIDEAIKSRGNDAVSVFLLEWSNTWGGQRRQAAPEPAQAEPVPPPLALDASVRVLPEYGQLETLVTQNLFTEALAATEALLQKERRADLGSVYYWRARAWLGQSQAATSSVEEDRRRAGLDFMRVVILYPDHERAAESLFLASAIRRQAGYTEQADQLLRELVSRYPQAEPWAKSAGRMLAAEPMDSAPAQ